VKPLAEGEAVVLTGTTRLVGPHVVAPLTGEPCVAHLSRARVFTRLDHTGDLLGNVESFDIAPFVLDAPNGSVLVIDRPARIELEPALLGLLDSGRCAHFLARRGLDAYVASSFFEHVVVRAGDIVTISGVITCEPVPALEASFRELPVRTRLTGYGKHPITFRVSR
jgi:hypothetical protein